jgi:hypothetical protein
LVQTVKDLGLTDSEAEAVADNVRNTSDKVKDQGFDVDKLFRGGLSIIPADLKHIGAVSIAGNINVVLETLKYVGFADPPTIRGLRPYLLSATTGDGTTDDKTPHGGTKQFISGNFLDPSETISVVFVIGLQQGTRFEFDVTVEGTISQLE